MFDYNLKPYHAVRPSWAITRDKIRYLPSSEELDLLIRAARVAPQERREEVEPGALEYVIDLCRATKAPAWDVLVDEYAEIMRRPGPGVAFKELLYSAEWWRLECQDTSGVVRAKIDQMIAFLVEKANARLEAYYQALGWNRGHPKDKRKVDDPPANIYRDYGPALRYATGELGSFAARACVRELSLQATLPFNEMENPDWIDPYTGDGDKQYEQIRLRASDAALSGDGNTPVLVADLLDSMGEAEREGFDQTLKQLGMDQGRYWKTFIAAQRGSFSADAEAVEGDNDHQIEKDFEFKGDLAIDREMVEEIRSLLASQLTAFRRMVYRIADRHPDPLKNIIRIHRAVLMSEPTRNLIRALQGISLVYEPQDLIAVILPVQNNFGLWVEDLKQIPIAGAQGNLASFFEMFGDEILEQFNDRAGEMAPEPSADELDQYVEDVVAERIRVYVSPRGARAWRKAYAEAAPSRGERLARANAAFVEQVLLEQAERQAAGKKQNARDTLEYVEAEVRAAIFGDGSQGSMIAAGWDAWRSKIDPLANREYKKAVAAGLRPAEAMKVFWREVGCNRSRIVGVTRDGLKLAGGRLVNWGIARLKIERGEIRMEPEQANRLCQLLAEKHWSPYLQSYLRARAAVTA